MDNYRLGIFYGLGAYLLWGVLPIYWKLLQHVEAMEILASRFFMVSRFRLSLVIGNRQAKHLHAGNQGDFQYEKDSLLHGVGSNYDQLQLGYFYLGGRSWTHCRNKHGLLYQPADECALWCSISA